MPGSVPSSLDNWWCDTSSEYAFVGFSYAVDACQSLDTLKREFKDIRNTFNGRYVRLYGACDKKGFYDNVVDAAWDAGIGVHALIWFGFDGGNIYKTRRDSLFNTLKSNPKAKFVTRVVQYGSEPLFDHVLPAKELAKEVESAKATLSNLRIPVTVSELSFGYTQPGQDKAGAMAVLKAIDFVDAHILPLFAGGASTAKNAWGNVMGDIKWFSENSGGKKIYLSENGWPSVKGQGNINPQSRTAVANVENEKDYFDMLDSKCSDLKAVKGGGVGWFAHLYSDSQGMGYGIYGTNGKLKFPFKPRTSC
ncbi:glycoside hydrolase superfamily [Ephemerocybe angulata]|uniref:glucan endo-1,3-beta-D-glucosidase n=1 Tax=Ephemerocybe angulata TaxID=980116 RepID=A0A8H6HN80_9AGAR|nr:glycoside hydrolase superfamily [Tulosesus angulatus]